MYENQINLGYLLFLRPIMADVQKVNKAFEAKNADQTKLLKDLMTLLSSLVKKVVIPTQQIDVLTCRLEDHLNPKPYLGYLFETHCCSLFCETSVRNATGVTNRTNLSPSAENLPSADNLGTGADRRSSGSGGLLFESTAVASLPVGHVEALARAHSEAFGVTVRAAVTVLHFVRTSSVIAKAALTPLLTTGFVRELTTTLESRIASRGPTDARKWTAPYKSRSSSNRSRTSRDRPYTAGSKTSWSALDSRDVAGTAIPRSVAPTDSTSSPVSARTRRAGSRKAEAPSAVVHEPATFNLVVVLALFLRFRATGSSQEESSTR
ncbi:hypothetical protein HPB48_011061 [Haemaphysalis longicornis]|uniref:Uncharacterized protein n=1 Tax=Haemaphysalis longicornis TaxID=44386 RepID=A0A9J6FAC9_HAELO|nr:hypothetical protein HPB48_011061 [Haemaphysalis longicornis]